MFPTEFVERIKTHILCIIIFFSENRAAYEIMWRGMVQTDRPQMTILYGARTLHAGWPYRNTLGIIIFMAFPQQQWFRTYIALFLFKDFYAVSVSDIWHILYFSSSCVSHMSCDTVEVLRTLTWLYDSEWWEVFRCTMWGNSAQLQSSFCKESMFASTVLWAG